jgi:hypothetical protein
VLALGLAGTATWALLTHRVYESEASILFERGVQSVGGLEGDTPNQVLLRLQDMLTARQRLEPIIKQLNLYSSTQDQRGMVGALEEMRKAIKIGGNGWFSFRVTFNAESRDVAQSVLERLVKETIDEDTQRRIHQAEEGKRFLDTEKERADENVKAKEGALGAFLAEHPPLALAGAAAPGGTIRAADHDRVAPTLGPDVAALELQAAQFEEALAALGKQAPGSTGPPPVEPELAEAQRRAHSELEAAQKDLQEKEARFTNEHPDVKAALHRVATADSSLNQVQRAIDEARKRAQANPAVEPAAGSPSEESPRVVALRHALAAVRAQIAGSRGRTIPRAELPSAPGTMVAVDTEWTRLSREATEARERQSQLETRQFQAQLLATLLKGGMGGRLVMIDSPLRSLRPISGRRVKVALVGSVMSIALAALATFVLAVFDDRLYNERDIERTVGEGVIVVIPRVSTKSG